MTVRHRTHELVPCQDEVGEDKQHSSKRIDAAALKKRHHQHCADQAGIYADSNPYYADRSAWNNTHEHNDKKHECTENHHGQISFGLTCELEIRLNLLEVPSDKIGYIPNMGDGEETHLREEVIA